MANENGTLPPAGDIAQADEITVRVYINRATHPAQHGKVWFTVRMAALDNLEADSAWLAFWKPAAAHLVNFIKQNGDRPSASIEPNRDKRAVDVLHRCHAYFDGRATFNQALDAIKSVMEQETQ